MKLNILFAICFLTACGKFNTSTISQVSDITVIDDRTDSFALHPIADPILTLYNFPDNQDKAANFRLVVITDKLLNPVENIGIDNSSVTEKKNERDEVDNREQIIGSFYDAVRNSIAHFPERYSSNPMAHSECFATIASELERLSKAAAAQKTLIVFSDLQENTDAFSCYSEHGQKLLRTNPQKVKDILYKNRPLPEDLQDITVYLVYQPSDRNEDERFLTMVGIYKQLLESRGARIIIQADNTHFE